MVSSSTQHVETKAADQHILTPDFITHGSAYKSHIPMQELHVNQIYALFL